MAVKVTATIVGEYRGAQPGGSFNDRDTGKPVEYGPKLKFEVLDAESGDVALVPLRAKDFDELTPAFDVAQLHRGDFVRMVAVFVIGGEGERSYLSLRSAEVITEAEAMADPSGARLAS